MQGNILRWAILLVAFGDWNSSNALAVGILAALWNAQRTGVGDKVVTSLYHVSKLGMMSAICAQQQGQQHPKIARSALPTNNSYRHFRWCVVRYVLWKLQQIPS